jgi:hypothetical protein
LKILKVLYRYFSIVYRKIKMKKAAAAVAFLPWERKIGLLPFQ